MAVNSVTSAAFDEKVLKSEKPVLVDFWAEWCGPCRMLSPVVDKLSEEYEGEVEFFKVNVDEESELAGRYGVMSIPTLLLFKNGAIAQKSIGFKPKAAIEEMFK